MAQDYFTRFFPQPAEIIQARNLFFRLERNYSRNPATREQAELVAVAYREFQIALRLVASQTATLANSLIIEKYHQSASGRPPTGSPPHLEEALPTSEAVQTPLPAGVVGIVKLDALEEFPYWKSQEFGREQNFDIRGWFFGTGFQGAFAPDPSMSGEHPLFRPSSTGRTMHVVNPIPERRFIRETVKDAHAFWRAEMEGVAADAVLKLRAIQGEAIAVGAISRGRRAGNFKRRLEAATRRDRARRR